MVNEKRLIDADKAFEIATEFAGQADTKSAYAAFWKVAKALQEMPTIDAVKVVHGWWYWADDGYCRCSECNQKAPVVRQYQDEPMTAMTNYCPNCGAKMDGDRNG